MEGVFEKAPVAADGIGLDGGMLVDGGMVLVGIDVLAREA